MNRVFSTDFGMIDPPASATPEAPVTAFYLGDKYRDFSRELAYPAGGTPEEIDVWRRALKTALWKVFTLDRLGTPPTPTYQILSREEEEGYTRLLIAYEVQPGNWVQAYLLLPRVNKPVPAVLCLHGHFMGAKDAVTFPDKAAGVAYAHEWASRGFVTLAPDGAGMSVPEHYGSNKRDVPADYPVDPREGGCGLLFRRLNHLGIDITGFRVYELMAAINLLQTMPQVQGNAIGCAGLSGGCWLTQVLTALDDRVKAAVMSGYFTTFVQTAWLGHCVCHHPFGIGLVCDMPDISALAAPRPQFVESGMADTNYPVHPAYELTLSAYRDAGAEERFGLHCFEGGHRFEGSQSVDWMVRQLSCIENE